MNTAPQIMLLIFAILLIYCIVSKAIQPFDTCMAFVAFFVCVVWNFISGIFIK